MKETTIKTRWEAAPLKMGSENKKESATSKQKTYAMPQQPKLDNTNTKGDTRWPQELPKKPQ